jgi:hypothetical protein
VPNRAFPAAASAARAPLTERLATLNTKHVEIKPFNVIFIGLLLL